MLMRPSKAETAVHGCHCPGDMAVRMRKTLVRLAISKKEPAETPVGVTCRNKEIRDRIDSDCQYGRWKLRVMGS